MFVQTITFRLDGISPAEFASINNQVATQYGGVPGLVSKIFLADPDDDHAYGGVYLWRTRADADRYLREGLAQVLVADPRFVDVEARTLAVLPGPTALTGGPVADVVAESAAGSRP